METSNMCTSVHNYLEKRSLEFDSISIKRKESLSNISAHIEQYIINNELFKGVIICTHNSRRSHFGQVWLAAAASFYGKDQWVKTYSGGTEATAVYPSVIKTFVQIGFNINYPSTEINNPHYNITWKKNMTPYSLFSKIYSDHENPGSHFAAIMVCNDADAACPIVQGAEQRFSLPYRDPKAFDTTEEEFDQYNNTSKIIAREMLFIMSQITS